jgi:hypothetical protein
MNQPPGNRLGRWTLPGTVFAVFVKGDMRVKRGVNAAETEAELEND